MTHNEKNVEDNFCYKTRSFYYGYNWWRGTERTEKNIYVHYYSCPNDLCPEMKRRNSSKEGGLAIKIDGIHRNGETYRKNRKQRRGIF